VITTNEQKEYIIESVKRFWFGYKVCEGCDIILAEDMPICPVCNAYRFDDSKERVVEVAEKLLERYLSTE
jgi:hypothetical protein